MSIQARQLEKRTEEISRSAYPEHGTCGLCEDQDLEQHGDKRALAFSKRVPPTMLPGGYLLINRIFQILRMSYKC